MNKWLQAVLIGIIVVVTILIGLRFILFSEPGNPAETGPFITSNPLELSQTKSISQFRSCEGHNFSGNNAYGEEETYRTMKHYVDVINPLSNTEQKVKIFAPFNGRVSQIGRDQRGSRVYLSPSSESDGWDFLFFHVDLLSRFNKEGTNIVSGDHIGFANLINGANFDIALRSFGFRKQRNGSPFNYMTEGVLSQYSSVGVTQENIIISKEERDASPCQLAPGQSGRDAFYARSESGKSWIPIQHE